jgi:hypothetical protein
MYRSMLHTMTRYHDANFAAATCCLCRCVVCPLHELSTPPLQFCCASRITARKIDNCVRDEGILVLAMTTLVESSFRSLLHIVLLRP